MAVDKNDKFDRKVAAFEIDLPVFVVLYSSFCKTFGLRDDGSVATKDPFGCQLPVAICHFHGLCKSLCGDFGCRNLCSRVSQVVRYIVVCRIGVLIVAFRAVKPDCGRTIDNKQQTLPSLYCFWVYVTGTISVG